ncbi:ALP1-like protein [Tanacetum coccineum]
MKCTFAIRQMTYGAVPDPLDEYLQMGAITTRMSLQMFCKAIMKLYGEEFLRKSTYTDMEKLYAHHEEKHGFSGMIENIDCTDWLWENCPVELRAQYVRGDHGQIHSFYWKRYPPMFCGFGMRSLVSPR